jgi:hypothetical protein
MKTKLIFLTLVSFIFFYELKAQHPYNYLKNLKVYPKLSLVDVFLHFKLDTAITIEKEDLFVQLGYSFGPENESKCEGAAETTLYILIDEYGEYFNGKIYKIGKFYEHNIEKLEYKNSELIIHISSAVCYQDRRKINYYKIKI